MADFNSWLVDLYDDDNPDGADHDFFRSLVEQPGVDAVLDLGCGTGMLTVSLAAAGRRVVGLDPSPAMLAYARERPGAEQVDWILGDSRSIPPGSFDVAVLSGNVAQHIPDPQWQRTLSDLHASLRPGAVLAFESRNPGLREWESWAGAEPDERDTAHGRLREWAEILQAEVNSTGEGVVRIRWHNEFSALGQDLIQDADFAFRSERTLTDQLDAAGFELRAISGDWQRGPVQADSRIFVFEALRR